MRKILKKMGDHKWFWIFLVLAVFLAYFRFSHNIIQQDNYVGYAGMLPASVNKISFFESRLFPGLPILIFLTKQLTGNYSLAGYVVTLLSFTGSYFLLYKITGSKLSALPLIFPPVLLNLATLIDTEFPFIFLTILGYYLVKNKRLALAFLAIGLSVWFRLAGFAVFGGIFIYFLLNRKMKKFLVNIPFFAAPVVLFLIFNTHFFGPQNPFYQLITYEVLHPGRISLGIIQLGADLVRAFRWHWYRILFSGLCYTVLYSALWFRSIRVRSLEFWIITGIYIFTLTINLVPFLENLGRYLVPVVPLFWIMFHSKFKSEKWLYFLLPISALVVLI